MANPQAEDGHTDIANEILEALWKINLSAYETRVLIFLLRKTYGWHKKTDRISLSQFSREIGMDRRLVHRTLKKLSSKGMIVVIPQDDRKPVSYGFQKDYQKWNLSSPKMTHHKRVIPLDDRLSSPEMTKLSSKGIPTKETTKETIQKKIVSDDEFILKLKENTAYKKAQLDIDFELAEMDSWILSHPGRKKTREFITRWLSKNARRNMALKPQLPNPISNQSRSIGVPDWIKDAQKEGWK